MIAIAELFYLIIKADDHVDAKELEMGRRMAEEAQTENPGSQTNSLPSFSKLMVST